MNTHHFTRRKALALGTGLMFSPALLALGGDQQRRFKIGACDWSIGRGGQLSALELAKQIGLDGVQVSFGKPGGEYDLRSDDVRRQYEQAAVEHGVEIASLAMGVLNSVPYSSDRNAERWVEECVEVMPKLRQKIVLLAFFSEGDIKDKPELQAEVIRRLKRVAPQAEKAGVVLGLETWLSADEHLQILDSVGSPAVQVYYDTANMEKQGYDIYKEIRQLGRERICEFHCKENGFLLGEGRVDFRRVKDAMDDIGYNGWLVIESAVGNGQSVQDSYVYNQKYLRSVFL
ncbi:MAG TPA: sugar phosphate isomerase/epimerase family protein [Planctomycetaceae bacterium]|nr:sugar phosphate isomerase/epimerase family protein [Planctomycetaceae bacterium]